jgi:hypothetical protein
MLYAAAAARRGRACDVPRAQTRLMIAGLRSALGGFVRLATSRKAAASIGSCSAARYNLPTYQLMNRVRAVRIPSTRGFWKSLPTAICHGMSMMWVAARKNLCARLCLPAVRTSASASAYRQATVMPCP